MTTAPLLPGHGGSHCPVSSVFIIQTQRSKVYMGSTGQEEQVARGQEIPLQLVHFVSSEHLT